MPTEEQQRILDQINEGKWGTVNRTPRYRSSELEATGWLGFFLGMFFAMVLFTFLILPIAQQEAVSEWRETNYQCPTNTGSIRPIP